jgi:hypothetical protein
MPMPRFASIAAGTVLATANAGVWVALVAAGYRIFGEAAPDAVLVNVAGLVFATSCAALWLLSANGAPEDAAARPAHAQRKRPHLYPRSV